MLFVQLSATLTAVVAVTAARSVADSGSRLDNEDKYIHEAASGLALELCFEHHMQYPTNSWML